MLPGTTHSSAPRGRFAPSPSGPLHFGSLVCALASYLDTRARGGLWLVRIEDIDPPREPPGTAAAILCCLEAHSLHWDGELLYQSQRGFAYRDTLALIANQGLSYACNCTRKRLAALRESSGTPAYDGQCRHRPSSAEGALRLSVTKTLKYLQWQSEQLAFEDLFQGHQAHWEMADDFIIHRRDGLFAYQLAVVVDDLAQGITQVVRGMDLLPSTQAYRLLWHLLAQLSGRAAALPVFGHIPVLVDSRGRKLSKQNRAPAIDNRAAPANMAAALCALGLPLPEAQSREMRVEEMLQWATHRWPPSALQGIASLPAPASFVDEM